MKTFFAALLLLATSVTADTGQLNKWTFNPSVHVVYEHPEELKRVMRQLDYQEQQTGLKFNVSSMQISTAEFSAKTLFRFEWTPNGAIMLLDDEQQLANIFIMAGPEKMTGYSLVLSHVALQTMETQIRTWQYNKEPGPNTCFSYGRADLQLAFVFLPQLGTEEQRNACAYEEIMRQVGG